MFFKVGGFDLRFSRMGEQKDLIRRIARITTFASITLPVACVIQDHKKSTADWAIANAQSLRSRDMVLDEPGSFALMLNSATSPFWRGKLIRAYATCVVWQIRNRNIVKIFVRLVASLQGIAVSLPYVFSAKFWKGLSQEG